MYLHLGMDLPVNTRDIVGLFDLDTASVSGRTREFLARAEREKRVVNVSAELPRSFALCAPPRRRAAGAEHSARGEHTLYIGQLTTATLKKRLVVSSQ